jgi:uncharacterized protein YjiS (DUF1127 family)
MTDTTPLVSPPRPAVQPGSPPRPAQVSHRHYGLANLRHMIAVWRLRRRFRWDLEQLAKDNPHLIYDIGLTRWQIEAEIAKRFWDE